MLLHQEEQSNWQVNENGAAGAPPHTCGGAGGGAGGAAPAPSSAVQHKRSVPFMDVTRCKDYSTHVPHVVVEKVYIMSCFTRKTLCWQSTNLTRCPLESLYPQQDASMRK